jgi:DNA-binding response OmpR family regulator
MTHAKTPNAAPKKGKKILVIEDEKPLAHALELKLTHEGYAVTVALTGEDGLKEILKGGYDLILLDLILPGMDGFAVLEQAKTHGKKANIIALSNLGQEEDRKKAEALGVKQYLVKSNVPLTEIVKTVRAAI